MSVMQNVRWEDWEYDYKYRNRFGFMGNGKPHSAAEPMIQQLNKMVSYVRNDEKPWVIE